MGRIDVDPGTFEAASKIFGHDVANALFEDYCVLQGALGDTGGMAGSDPAGVRWRSSYDAALVQISGVTQDVINGVYTLAGLLVTTGFNHGLANSASEPGGTHDVVDHEDYGGDSVGLGGFQTASGSAGSDEPTGRSTVSNRRRSRMR